MHTGTHYSLFEFLVWTRRDIFALLVIATLPTLLHEVVGWHWLAVPWVPIALVGTAAAFLVGFKNTQTYNRLWEARQIYGAIVNGSRTWGILVNDVLGTPGDELQEVRRTLIYRHIAWLTALRFQLREHRSWENTRKVHNREYARYYTVDEWVNKLEEELPAYLSPEDLQYVLAKKNRATHIISLQSKHLRTLAEAGALNDFRLLELERQLADFYDQQGKCERIKNFPYPRQFATINLFFIRLFVLLVPFGMLNEFDKLGEHYAWATIPFSLLVGWVFNGMEKIGESTENPFEGGANDVPITTLSRTIEIDLRELLDETDLPPALQPMNKILM
jgi:ion channel-forming bestrophin family protein